MKTTLWPKLQTPLLGCGCLLTALVAAWAVGTTAVTANAAEPQDKSVAVRSDEAVPAPTAPGETTAPSPTKPGLVSALVAGREVTVTAPDTSASINVVGPTAEVRVGPQLLVVEKSQMTLDGQPLGQLPPDTKKIEVILGKGMLSVKGDGKEIARAKVGSDALPGSPATPPQLKP